MAWLVASNWWQAWWLGLFFSSFLDIFGRLGHEKSPKIAEKAKTGEKLEKQRKNNQKVGCLLSVLDLKIDEKTVSGGSGGKDVGPGEAMV